MSRIKDTYVPVNVRVMEARKEHGTKLTIKTGVSLFPESNAALVSAEVSVDGKTLSTGHSLVSELNEPKSLEKAESVAVGRALAFAGYSADSAIASEEEMDDAPQSTFTSKGSTLTTKPTGFGRK